MNAALRSALGHITSHHAVQTVWQSVGMRHGFIFSL
jgi:hypothetical protein